MHALSICFEAFVLLQVTIAGRGGAFTAIEPTQPGQWLVPARKDGLMSIMTPVYPNNETLSLLSNQVLLFALQRRTSATAASRATQHNGAAIYWLLRILLWCVENEHRLPSRFGVPLMPPWPQY